MCFIGVLLISDSYVKHGAQAEIDSGLLYEVTRLLVLLFCTRGDSFKKKYHLFLPKSFEVMSGLS